MSHNKENSENLWANIQLHNYKSGGSGLVTKSIQYSDFSDAIIVNIEAVLMRNEVRILKQEERDIAVVISPSFWRYLMKIRDEHALLIVDAEIAKERSEKK